MSQVVIGGPFESHIECIIRHKASLMKSMVISACDPGIQKTLKWLRMEEDGKPSQTCDIVIQLEDLQMASLNRLCPLIRFFLWDWIYLYFSFLLKTCQRFPSIWLNNSLFEHYVSLLQFITVPNVNLHLIGAHQLQNAVTATCTALCLRDQGEFFFVCHCM